MFTNEVFPLTIITIYAIAAVIAIVDVLLLVCCKKKNRTISAALYCLSRDWPVIPFVIGFLAGHIFFPVTYEAPRKHACKVGCHCSAEPEGGCSCTEGN